MWWSRFPFIRRCNECSEHHRRPNYVWISHTQPHPIKLNPFSLVLVYWENFNLSSNITCCKFNIIATTLSFEKQSIILSWFCTFGLLQEHNNTPVKVPRFVLWHKTKFMIRSLSRGLIEKKVSELTVTRQANAYSGYSILRID